MASVGPATLRGSDDRTFPPVSETERIFTTALTAEWWTRPRKGRRAEDKIKGMVKKWAANILEAIGYKPYQKLAWTTDGAAGVAVKASGRDGYRLLLITVSDIYTVKVKGFGKISFPLEMAVYYGKMAKKNAMIIDPILPRLKRRFVAPSRVITVKRNLKEISVGKPSQEQILAGLPSISKDEGEPKVFRLVEESSIIDPKKGTLLIRSSSSIICSRGLIEYEEYRAKYVIIIPPLIMWKWGSYLIPRTIIREEVDDEVECQALLTR